MDHKNRLVTVLGPSGSGKTSLLRRLSQDKYRCGTPMVDHNGQMVGKRYCLKLPDIEIDNGSAQINVYDINTEINSSLWETMVLKSSVVAIVFDHQSSCAHEDSIHLLDNVRRIRGSANLIFILTKCDHVREVKTPRIANLCHIYTSLKNDRGISHLATALQKLCYPEREGIISKFRFWLSMKQ